jgi:quercetin dioxygenase-like cupin family protein
MVIDHDPPEGREANRTAVLHHADSLNLVLVQRGSVDLQVVEGTRTLVAGDSFVITGVDHAYVAGPEGCRLVVVTVGTPPPA